MDSEKEQKESLDYAIARDKLIWQGVLPDDPIVKGDDAYWEQFKWISRRKMEQGRPRSILLFAVISCYSCFPLVQLNQRS